MGTPGLYRHYFINKEWTVQFPCCFISFVLCWIANTGFFTFLCTNAHQRISNNWQNADMLQNIMRSKKQIKNIQFHKISSMYISMKCMHFIINYISNQLKCSSLPNNWQNLYNVIKYVHKLFKKQWNIIKYLKVPQSISNIRVHKYPIIV